LDYLLKLVESRRSRGLTRAELAAAMGCQAAYFSQVLKGRVHLTEDHGLKLCEFLDFSDAETEYFLILLRLARAGTPQLTRYLQQERAKLLEKNTEVERHVAGRKQGERDEITFYYSSSWIPSVIHIATSCEDLQTAEAIAERFGLPPDVVEHHLKQMERYGLVESDKKSWRHKGFSVHFPKGSHLDTQFQTTRRLLAMNALSFRRKDQLHYSVLFSTDAKTHAALREILVNTIDDLHRIVEPSPGEDVYCFCIDSFRV
jgi:uncharacterized protein (TIGR02147 family)